MSPSLNLRELIRASGSAGLDGQSFKSNVKGAGTGVSMRSYLLGIPAAYGGQPQPPAEITYTSGTSFNYDIFWSAYGENFNQIRNGLSSWQQFGTAEMTINSATWSESLGKVTLNFTVFGEYDPNTSQRLDTFGAQYENNGTPTGQEGFNVVIIPFLVGGTTPSGADNLTVQFYYDPDTAFFNPTVLTSTFTMRITRRAFPSWNVMYEWEVWRDGTYDGTDALFGINGFSTLSFSGTTFTYYVRYRLRSQYGGNGTWTNFGAVQWMDPRPAQ